jgi:hypothetical protein
MHNNDASSGCLLSMAKRELGAFMGAATDLYGPKRAEFSAGDWLDELESIDASSDFTSRILRQVTIAAAARLAKRQLVVAQPPL